ncbi:hypothetical protein NW754_000090 [Fusarium falciforme]|nr:hypothetical protein NW754_000090 [Fusarium falciforme]
MDGSHDLCNACRAVDIAKYLSHNDPISTPMGYFQDILKNENCTLCKLVIKALSVYAQSYWQPGKYPVEMCYLGRLSGNSSPGRIEVWFHATSKTLPDGIWGHRTVLGRIKYLDSVEPRVLERLNYSLIRSWVDDCTTRHGPKCNPPGPGRDFLPLILLDVKQMRLFKSDRHCRYLALSYVWGKAKQFRTVKSNFQELQQDGALLRVRDQLPQLINDAIAFVADLGETYLWVDALCIVQDDPEVKELYVPYMDKIYGQALLTIVFLAGSDANCALPGVATGSRTPSQSPVQLGSLILAPELRSLAATVESSTWRSRDSAYEFVLLSRSDQDKIIQADVDGYRDHLPPEYPSADEYYEEIFDTSIYQYKGWWALNILLVERKGDLSQRLAVGQLHADAWDAARQKMKSFVLV